MAIYQCRGGEYGLFDVRRPIGTAEETALCPACGGDAVRVFSPPMLAHTSPALAAHLVGLRRVAGIARGEFTARFRARLG